MGSQYMMPLHGDVVFKVSKTCFLEIVLVVISTEKLQNQVHLSYYKTFL